MRSEYPVGAALLGLYGAAAVLILLPLHLATTAHQLAVFGLFFVLSTVVTLVCAGAERIRHISTGGMVLDSVDVWAFAAALVLPSHFVLILAVWGFLLAARAWHGRQLWKWVASVLTLVVAAGVAMHILASSTPRPVAVGSAVLVFGLTQAALTGLVMMTTGVTSVSEELFSSPRAWLASFTNLGLGVALGELSRWSLWAVVGFVPILIVVQVALSKLQQRGPLATTDPHTGALREGVWRHLAAERLPDPRWAVLTVDVQTAGSAALVCAAGVIRDRLQLGECIGRSGSGFAVLVNVSEENAGAWARAIEDEVLTAVGVEVAVGWSSHEGSLEAQLAAADDTLVARAHEEISRLARHLVEKPTARGSR